MSTAYESLAGRESPLPAHVKQTLDILEARATIRASGGSRTATHALADALTPLLQFTFSELPTGDEYSFLKTSAFVALEWLDARIKYGSTELTSTDRDVIEVARRSIEALGRGSHDSTIEPLIEPFLGALRLGLITSIALLPNRSAIQSNKLRTRIRQLAPKLASDALAIDSHGPLRLEKLWILGIACDALAVSLAPSGQKLVREVDHIKQSGSLTPYRFARILRFLQRNGEPLAGPATTDAEIDSSIQELHHDGAIAQDLDLPRIAAIEHNRSRNGRGLLGVFNGLKQTTWEAAVRSALIPLIITPLAMYLVLIIWRLSLGVSTIDIDLRELGRGSVPGDVFAASIGLLATSATILVALSVSANDKSTEKKADFNQMAAAHRWWNRGQLLLILIATLNLTLGGLSLLLANRESSILPLATILIGALNWIMATSIETLEQSRNIKMATLEYEVALMQDSISRIDQTEPRKIRSRLGAYTLLAFFFTGPLLLLSLVATATGWTWNEAATERLEILALSVLATIYLATPAFFIVEARISTHIPVAIRSGQRAMFVVLGYGIEIVLIFLILTVGAAQSNTASWIACVFILIAQAGPVVLFAVKRWPLCITRSPARLARVRLADLTQRKEAQIRHSESY